MHSKLASIIARRSNRLYGTTVLRRGLATSTPYRTADPAIHAQDDEAHQPAVPQGNPEETNQVYQAETGKAEYEKTEEEINHNKPPKGTEPLKQPKPPHRSFPTLEATGVHNPADPTFHQTRKNHNHGGPEELGCSAGVEALPSQDDDDDDRGYYLRHKASPLAEIELADTRKPITQATDGGGGAEAGSEVSGWLPEQLLSAEETMMRAAEMWRRNAMRGDPDSPHGRVLRAMRGEDF